ncbi:MAG: site-2 protease family protein [Chloroflexota bacterium]|nr:site-2 protease family protein [Chloroflexota bacterium]
MGTSIRLGRIFGIPIGISYSWFLVFALITYTLAREFDMFPGWSDAARWLAAVVTSILFFASVLFHELSHALLARRKGIPVKGITLFIFGGIAQITEEAKKPSTELLIGGVGPLSSLVLSLAFLGASFLLRLWNPHFGTIAFWLFGVNMLLAVFNMVPGFPMDGGRVFRAVLWWVTGDYYKATSIATWAGRAIGMAMIVGGVAWAFFGRDLLQGLWLALIGWFLTSAASATQQQLKVRKSLDGRRARDLMDFNCPTVPGDISVSTLVESYVVPTGNRLFVVGDLNTPQGVVSVRDIKLVGRKQWPATLVQSVMRPLEAVRTVEPGEDAFRVLEVMEEAEVSEIPVKYDGRIVGVIGRESILRFLRARSDLGM